MYFFALVVDFFLVGKTLLAFKSLFLELPGDENTR